MITFKKHMTKVYAALIVCVLLLTMIAIYCETQPQTFVGYFGNQPETKVTLLPNSIRKKDVPEVIQLAKNYWPPPEDHWAEPSSVWEQETCWLVHFTAREKVFRSFLGKETIQSVIPGTTCIQVEKTDFSCRLAPAR